VAIIAIGAGAFFAFANIGILSIASANTVQLGEAFTITAGETVQIKDKNHQASFTLLDYSPPSCGSTPSNTGIIQLPDQCGFAGPQPQFDYTLTVGDTTYEYPEDQREVPLHIKYDWDNNREDTLAGFVIDTYESNCLKDNEPTNRRSCLNRVAVQFTDTSYCDHMDTTADTTHCIESVAHQLKDYSICSEITADTPKAYCLIPEAVRTNNLSLCFSPGMGLLQLSCAQAVIPGLTQEQRLNACTEQIAADKQKDCLEIMRLSPIRAIE
jgi:hypothetical protein